MAVDAAAKLAADVALLSVSVLVAQMG